MAETLRLSGTLIAPLILNPAELHIWHLAHLPGVLPVGLLAPDEVLRMQQFLLDRDRCAFSQTRAVLRLLLSAYTGIPPEQHILATTARRKPVLVGGCVHFNVSHSAGRSILGFAREPLGVDIEEVRAIPEIEGIAQAAFSPTEYGALLKLGPESRVAAFFRCWCRKEAFVKALGEGFHYPFDSFDISIDPDEEPRVLSHPEWSLLDLSLPGYAASVATRWKPTLVKTRSVEIGFS